jgi:two-component system, OmpR family, sensor histidine kinase PrrB
VPGSLRARLTLATGLVVLLAGAIAVVVLLAAVSHDGRRAVDAQLRDRAASVTRTAGPGPGAIGPAGPPLRGLGPSRRGPEPLLAGAGTFVQVALGDEVVQQRGDVPLGAPAVPAAAGLATLDIGGVPWRSLTVAADTPAGPARLQLLQSLAPVEDRVAAVRRIVLLVGLLALALAMAGAWLLTGVAVRPLARLRHSAAQIATTDDLGTPLAVADGPDEVRALGAALNAMLARLAGSTEALQRALEATRRFAGDAGHELRTPLTGLRANVDVLRRNPTLEAAERDALLADVAGEQERVVHLLDGLTALARGDAADSLPREPVELGDLVDVAVTAARRRHPAVRWELEEDVGDATVHGWAGGLRLLVDNLLENAALHGRPQGRVRVAVRDTGDGLSLRVDDDGPGIPPEEREAVLAPFHRGGHPRSPGTGLGLAIAAQQASLHGGALTLSRADLGGLRAEVVLSRAENVFQHQKRS